MSHPLWDFQSSFTQTGQLIIALLPHLQFRDPPPIHDLKILFELRKERSQGKRRKSKASSNPWLPEWQAVLQSLCYSRCPLKVTASSIKWFTVGIKYYNNKGSRCLKWVIKEQNKWMPLKAERSGFESWKNKPDLFVCFCFKKLALIISKERFFRQMNMNTEYQWLPLKNKTENK